MNAHWIPLAREGSKAATALYRVWEQLQVQIMPEIIALETSNRGTLIGELARIEPRGFFLKDFCYRRTWYSVVRIGSTNATKPCRAFVTFDEARAAYVLDREV